MNTLDHIHRAMAHLIEIDEFVSPVVIAHAIDDIERLYYIDLLRGELEELEMIALDTRFPVPEATEYDLQRWVGAA